MDIDATVSPGSLDVLDGRDNTCPGEIAPTIGFHKPEPRDEISIPPILFQAG